MLCFCYWHRPIINQLVMVCVQANRQKSHYEIKSFYLQKKQKLMVHYSREPYTNISY